MNFSKSLLKDFPFSKISLFPVARFVTIANSDLFSFFFIISFKVSNESAWEVGLACGGEIAIYLEQIN